MGVSKNDKQNNRERQMSDQWMESIIAWIDYRIGQFDLDKSNDLLVVEARELLPATTNLIVSDDELRIAFDRVRMAENLRKELEG